MSPLVRINLDSAEKIAELHGVGLKLAAKIVRHREAHGFFNGPSDLDKVEGISMSLALTLSPHINWSSPDIVAPPQPGDRTVAVSFMAGGLALVLLSFVGFRLVNQTIKVSLTAGQLNARSWSRTFFSAAIIALSIFFVTRGMIELTSSAGRKKLLVGVNRFCAIATSAALLLAPMARLSHHDLTSVEGLRLLSLDTANVGRIVMQLVMSVITLPFIITVISPRTLDNRFVQRAYDAIVLGTFSLASIFVYLPASDVPLPLGITWGAFGLLLVLVTISSFRTEDSLLKTASRLVSYLPQTSGEDKSEYWLMWLNKQLPDTEQQRALSYALAQKYPPSRLRGFMSIAIITVGGWLFLTAVGAFIEWVVQNWLNDLTVPKP